VSIVMLRECCVNCHVTRWEEDTFSKGAYSGFQLGTMDWHCAELSRSEWDGHLIFAGEATHQEYEGSVHAALLSGVEGAKKIVSVVPLKTCIFFFKTLAREGLLLWHHQIGFRM